MRKFIPALLGMVMLSLGISATAFAAGPTKASVLMDQSQITLRDFQKAPEMDAYRSALKDAKGVLVVPSLVKAGLIWGGSGGSGVYFTKEGKSGLCKGPAFYTMGSVTFGLQIGAEKAEVVMLAMTDGAVKAMLAPQFKLGADVSVAAGPVGVGAAGHAALPTAAFIVFSRAKGAFAGLTLEGAIVAINKNYNRSYYGRNVDTADILIKGAPSHAGGLCAMIVGSRHK